MKKTILLGVLLILSACGTTSQMRTVQKPMNSEGTTNSQKSSNRPDLSKYNMVIVNDFTDGVTKSQDDPRIIAEGKKFADIIASFIKKKNIFNKVGRNIYFDEQALLIDGKITEHEEGDPVYRAVMGFWAGRSHFDAKVDFKDNITKELLAEIDVDKKSWAMGGMVAAGQDVNSHMNDAAKKIANELTLAKK